MLIGRRRPESGMATGEPIDAYSWELHQDWGLLIDAATESSDGIAGDGLSFEFRPETAPTLGMERQGPPQGGPRPALRFATAEHAQDGGVAYRYSRLDPPGRRRAGRRPVDFNWGAGGADRGHWVRAAAAGGVSKVDPANGQFNHTPGIRRYEHVRDGLCRPRSGIGEGGSARQGRATHRQMALRITAAEPSRRTCTINTAGMVNRSR